MAQAAKTMDRAFEFKPPNVSPRLMVHTVSDMPQKELGKIEILLKTRDGLFTSAKDINDKGKAIPFEKEKDRIEKNLIYKLRTWGTRGSISTPSTPEFITERYGGRTTSFSLTTKDGEIVMFDIGTGAIPFGKAIVTAQEPSKGLYTILQTHYHRDHLDGMGFFIPVYGPNNEIVVIGPQPKPSPDPKKRLTLQAIYESQMGDPYFPMTIGKCGAKVEFVEIQEAYYSILGGKATIQAKELNHPNNICGYTFAMDNAWMTNATDVEHFTGSLDQRLVHLAKNADVLLYDAQYTPEEYGAGKIGWGHSTIQEGIKVVKAAMELAGREIPEKLKGIADSILLVGVHHDPGHDDAAIDKVQAAAQEIYPNTVMAREDLEILFLRKGESQKGAGKGDGKKE